MTSDDEAFEILQNRHMRSVMAISGAGRLVADASKGTGNAGGGNEDVLTVLEPGGRAALARRDVSACTSVVAVRVAWP